jgi:prepilin-type N-terminal cleavage/methylation domain-containing protein
MTAINKNEHGFSLIELMVGILIVTIGVVALYQMFIVGNQLIIEEYHRRLALERAQAVMEGMNYYPNKGEAVPLSLAGIHHEDLVPPSRGDLDGIQGTCRITISHSSDYFPHSSRPVYSRVGIVYSWTEKSGREQSIKMESFF